MDASELIDRAVAVPDADSHEYADLIAELHGRTDRDSFTAAVAAARSPEYRRRLAGTDVLGQIGYSANRPFLDETLVVLLAEAGSDTDAWLTASAVFALGHLHDPRTRPALLARVNHPDERVRFAVAFALPGSTDPESPDAEVVAALIRLSRDGDADVRDWATFGVGTQITWDSPEIRAALTARLDDPDQDTAEEARNGLALRSVQVERGQPG